MFITTALIVSLRHRLVRTRRIAQPRRARLPFVLTLVLLLAFAGFLPAPCAARGDPAPLLTINVFVQDLAGVSSEELDEATEVVSSVYERIGIQIRWFVGEDAARTVPPELRTAFCRTLFNISLLPDTAAHQLLPRPTAATMGMAAPGTRFARVLAQRVRETAVASRLEEGRLLGYVIAHEIGHLLLPAGSHSANGLMSADLNLLGVRLGQLWFDEQQGAWIRRAVAQRPSTPI